MVSSRVYPSLERKPGKDDNWVDRVGGLPDFMERVAKHIYYENTGYTISHAIAAAHSQLVKWAAKGNLQAIKALAEFHAKAKLSKVLTAARKAV